MILLTGSVTATKWKIYTFIIQVILKSVSKSPLFNDTRSKLILAAFAGWLLSEFKNDFWCVMECWVSDVLDYLDSEFGITRNDIKRCIMITVHIFMIIFKIFMFALYMHFVRIILITAFNMHESVYLRLFSICLTMSFLLILPHFFENMDDVLYEYIGHQYDVLKPNYKGLHNEHYDSFTHKYDYHNLGRF